MNEHVVIGRHSSGGYLCMNNLHALMAAWLDASQGRWDCVQVYHGVKCEVF